LGYTIQFARKEQVENDKKDTSEPFYPERRLPWRRYGFRIGLTHVSGFGVRAGVTLLFVRFLERGGGKSAEIEKRLADYVGGMGRM